LFKSESQYFKFTNSFSKGFCESDELVVQVIAAVLLSLFRCDNARIASEIFKSGDAKQAVSLCQR